MIENTKYQFTLSTSMHRQWLVKEFFVTEWSVKNIVGRLVKGYIGCLFKTNQKWNILSHVSLAHQLALPISYWSSLLTCHLGQTDRRKLFFTIGQGVTVTVTECICNYGLSPVTGLRGFINNLPPLNLP